MNLLSNIQLRNKIRSHSHPYSKRLFLGVFSRDSLPTKVANYPCTLIINTDTKNLPGKHWVAIYISSFKEGEYFDSFGCEPPQDVALWMNKFTIKWNKLHSVRLQNPLSTACGKYVLFFVNERPLVNNYSVMKSVFTADTVVNDDYVKQYFEKNFVH